MPKQERDLLREMAAASCAVSTASALLNPVDAMKVRIQTEGQLTKDADARVYRNMFRGLRLVFQQEGIVGVWSPGLGASVLRDVVNGGLRIGIYPHVRDSLPDWMFPTVSAGLITGAVGSFLGNPTDIVKIRQQGEAGRIGVDGRYSTGLYRGTQPTYRHVFHGLSTVIGAGPKEFLKGVEPSMVRAALVTCGQMTGYHYGKQYLKVAGMQDGPLLFAAGGIIAGCAAATISCPADVIKTRIMNDRKYAQANESARQGFLYKGVFDCVKKSVVSEGPLVFWRGWWPAWFRLGPHSALMLPLLEIVRTKVFGLGYM